MKAMKSELAERVLRAGVDIRPNVPFEFDGRSYTPVLVSTKDGQPLRRIAVGGNQGKGDPPAFHPHRLRPQDFDTLGDRPPTDGYSVWARIFALIFFIVVVTVVSYLRRQG